MDVLLAVGTFYHTSSLAIYVCLSSWNVKFPQDFISFLSLACDKGSRSHYKCLIFQYVDVYMYVCYLKVGVKASPSSFLLETS